MEKERLTYVKAGDVALDIDLHNNYIVRAIGKYNKDTKEYDIEYYIKEKTIEKYYLIETLNNISFNATYKTIYSAILKHVSTLLAEDYFNDVINNYEYEDKCFELGNEVFELQRKKYSSKNE